jgi:hypothetical protein
MPRTALTNIIEPTRAGVAFPAGTAADVVNGNSIVNDSRVIVIAINSSGSTIRNVVVTPSATVDGLAVATRTTPIPISSSVIMGPWDVGTYGTSLALTADSATDVKFQVIHFPG